MSLKPVNVGLLGLGTVGTGTLKVLARNADEIARRAGRGIRVTHASARDLAKPRAHDLQGIHLCADPFEVVREPSVKVVAELIGGTGKARELVLEAIAHEKHVVTANKALLALHGAEIFEAAQRKGVVVAFEAAVAGGIPVIKAIREGLAGNRIEWLAGIINGTCNYILSQMQEAGRDFADVLKEAQALGYAEADPGFDIDGVDAAHKLTILASIAFGIPLDFGKLSVDGIRGVSARDIAYARELGYRIKHLGIARRRPEGVELRVQAALISQREMLAGVNGVMNAVMVKGDAAGPTAYYGAGAGAEATASAVVADLVDVVRTLTTDPHNRVPHLAFQPDAINPLPVLAPVDYRSAYYLCLQVVDKPGVLARIAQVLAEHDISIEAIRQQEPKAGATAVDVVILTGPVREGCMLDAQRALEALDSVRDGITRLRVEHLEQ
ncbi:MAG TPA: homoserine dehydrogenase [Nevskiales bacterium]|nr:homoserine dehydrogenase [Nevskiales bacterium]